MQRRQFLSGLLGFGAVATGIAALGGQAQAAPLPVVEPAPSINEAERQEADFRPDVDAAPQAENVQYYYYRRPRRRVVYRRVYYRPRRVYYRPRRVYYRPRRVYYRRPRRVIYF